jgi:uncharacterized repeat protein (TIGR01451 family)
MLTASARALIVITTILLPAVALPAPLESDAPGSLKVSIDAPAVRYVGRQAKIAIRITNTEKRKVENITVKVAVPSGAHFEEADSNGVFRDGAVAWTVGALDGGASRTVSFKIVIDKKNPAARFAVRATGDDRTHGGGEAATEFIGLPAARLEVIDSDDPIQVGDTTTYKIDVTNQGSEELTDVRIVATVPSEYRIVSTTGPVKATIDGLRVSFPKIEPLKPGQSATYTVRVKALKTGDARFRVELSARELGKTPVIEEEPTRIFDKVGK